MAFYVPGCPPKTVIPIEKALHPTTRNTEHWTRNAPQPFKFQTLKLFKLLATHVFDDVRLFYNYSYSCCRSLLSYQSGTRNIDHGTYPKPFKFQTLKLFKPWLPWFLLHLSIIPFTSLLPVATFESHQSRI